MQSMIDDEFDIFNPSLIEEIQKDNPFVRISEAVYGILEDAILTSKLKPGSKLKINKIAEELNVSGTPVREAVDRLSSRGLVIESMINGGKYKNYYVFDLNEDDIANLFEARKAIESIASYICAEKNWLIDFDKLQQFADGFEKDMKDFMEGKCDRLKNEYDRKFHNFIVHSTKNPYLIEMYETIDKKLAYLSIRTVEYMAIGSRNDKLHMLCNQHNSVMNAMRMGFPDLAQRAMDSHIDFCEENCLANKKEFEYKK